MITINRDEFRKFLAGSYAVSTQSYSKEEASKFIEGGMITYDLLIKAFNKIEIKQTDTVDPKNEQTNSN